MIDLNYTREDDSDGYLAQRETCQEDGALSEMMDVGHACASYQSIETTEQAGSAFSQPNQKKSRRYYTEQQRQEIYTTLLERSCNGRLKRDSTKQVAETLNVNKRTVQRIWKIVKDCREKNVSVNVSSRKPRNCGRKKKDLDLSRVRTIPLNKRSTIRSLAEALDVNRSTLHRRFKEGLLRRHSSTLKPYLKEANKKARLQFCVSMLDPNTLHDQPMFLNMHNIIHIDEKWFDTIKKDRNFYMLTDEPDPNRTVHNKNAIGKVMFLSAVARPMYDESGNCTFDGKIGLWPFVRQVPAQRSSRNRSRGTMVTKTMKVDRDLIRRYMIGRVLPTIKAAWPREQARRTIWIQQDNAKTHLPVDDEEFCRAARETGLNICLMNQPANSPDLNVLDLGFFASLQSLIDKRVARNIDDLILNVEEAFHAYDHAILNKVFLTLQGCMIEVMKAGGGNGYKIPHINKDRLTLSDNLPLSLSCDSQLLQSVITNLDNQPNMA